MVRLGTLLTRICWLKSLQNLLPIRQESVKIEELQGEPAVLLRQLAETYFTKVADNPDYLALFRVIVAESERFPELAKLYTHTVIQRGRQLLSQYFACHSELGIADPEAMAQIFFGSLVSYVMVQQMLYGNEMMPLGRDLAC